MSFAVELLLNRNISDNWGGKTEIKTPRLRYELTIERRKDINGFDELFVKHEQLTRINTEQDKWSKKYLRNKHKEIWKNKLSGGSAKPFISTEEKDGHITIRLRQDGQQGGKAIVADTINQTVLGSVNTIDFPHALAVKEELKSWNFMQLNPEILREPTKMEANFSDVIGHSGENLAAALFRLKSEDPYILIEISRSLTEFLPEYKSVDVINDTANRQFVIQLKDNHEKIFSSRVLSEGTLRLLTLCVLLYDDRHQGLLCFEEPENGVHPFRICLMEKLLNRLSADFSSDPVSLRQVIVNTHSPLLLQEIVNDHDNPTNTSIWFSKLTSQIRTIEDKRITMNVTRLIPLSKELQAELDFSDIERKMTVSDADRYFYPLQQLFKRAQSC